MPRRPAVVTQADVARALRAVRDSGKPAAVEIRPDGTIWIHPGQDRQSAPKLPIEPKRIPVL